jgi:hypothetical protein
MEVNVGFPRAESFPVPSTQVNLAAGTETSLPTGGKKIPYTSFGLKPIILEATLYQLTVIWYD